MSPLWIISWLLLAIVLIVIVASWFLAKTDLQRFISGMIITVLVAILGVFAAAAFALNDRENDERSAAAAALNPYGTTSILASYSYINNWVAGWEKNWGKQDRDYEASFEKDLRSRFEPVAAFDKISENPNVTIYLSQDDYVQLQTYRIGSHDWTAWIPQQENKFCLQVRSMQQYLKALRASWEFLTQKAEELHPDGKSQSNFREAYTIYVSRVKGKNIEKIPHDEDPLFECK